MTEEEMHRLAKIAEVDRYLAELERELGPVPPAEAQAAREWAERAFGKAPSAD